MGWSGEQGLKQRFPSGDPVCMSVEIPREKRASAARVVALLGIKREEGRGGCREDGVVRTM